MVDAVVVTEKGAQIAQDLPVQPQCAGAVAVPREALAEAVPVGGPVGGVLGGEGRVGLGDAEARDVGLGGGHATPWSSAL